MASSTTGYKPRSWRRVCDICGNLRQIEEMHKQDELWVCTYDYGERVRTELDRGNARQRPFTIKPVPHAKPWDNYYPNSLETDEAATFNFLAQQVDALCRYERVDSGGAPYTSAGGALPALSWAARYYYDLIIADDRELLVSKARELLDTIAAYLLTQQTLTGTRATNAFYGGFPDSTYVTNDTATSGLAMLYAYRIFGTTAYLQSARDAASYLRNVQAIGSNGTNFTSSDSAGTARLYTGSLASEVATAAGFYSNSLFYPSALIALEFWNELKLTDGDQSVGTTGTPTGFASAAAQLLSTSITDLRTCWEAGIDGTIGLSITTPREYFNAYPATKTEFLGITGTGEWEYADAGSTGTLVSSQNWGIAVSALYNYEGATATVTGISDWLRTFTSNADFETPDDTSTSDLYLTTTGEYDPTITIATLLQVRDPDAFTATAINGSSLYDWGAFGLLSRLWASRNTASFRTSRLYPLNTVQRFYNGNATDTATDRIILRGLSGLTDQTGFRVPPSYPNIPQPANSVDLEQGSDLEWDEGGISVPADQFPAFNYFVFTTVDDPGALNAFPYIDAGDGEFPGGGFLRLGNGTGNDRVFNHLGITSVGQLPFSLTSAAATTVPDGSYIDFVRIGGVWLQTGLFMLNDAVRAAQYGRAFRESRS